MKRLAGLVLILLGALFIPMGGLWIGQGLGLVMWPAQSFMLAQPVWSVWGALLALVGIVFVATGRKLTRKP